MDMAVVPNRVKHYSKKTDRSYWTSVLSLKWAARTSGDVRFHYVAFDAAFGGKADMPYCTAHVRF